MVGRELMLKTIYKEMWMSADFESDFQRDWTAVYEALKNNKENDIYDSIIACCYQYWYNWKNGD